MPDNNSSFVTDAPGAGKLPGKNDWFAAVPSWLPVTVILALTALIYSRALFNDFTAFDDNVFILKNPLVQDTSWHGIRALFASFHSGKYQPLVTLTFLLENRFFGFNPFVFHLDNVLLHLANTWVVYKFSEKLSGKWITAAVVASLFALHPMHVEEVAWASERKDLLYALFYLLALLCYLYYLSSGLRSKYLVAAFLLFTVSLFSKSSAMTLPVVYLSIDMYKGRLLNNRAWLEKVPFFIVAGVFFLLGMHSHHEAGLDYHMQPIVSFVNRIFLFTSVPAFYIIKLFAPFGLSAMHYYPDMHSGILPWPYYASLPFLLCMAWLFIRQNPFQKEMIFGLSFFIITISVMEQIISVGPALTPERYTYIPYIGFFYIIGQWLAGISAGRPQDIAFGVFALFLVMFGIQTWVRIRAWKDSDSVFNDILDHNEGSPDCFYIYLLKGDLRFKEGKVRDAIANYNESIALNPGYAESYNNRGVAFFNAGDAASALLDLNNAIQLDPKRPKPYDNRASAEASAGDFKGAINDYNYYLTQMPADSRAYTDRGMVRLSLRDSSGACADWRKAAKLGNETAPQLLQQYCH